MNYNTRFSLTPLSYAIRYADRGKPVFPLHTPIEGKCSCGKEKCKDQGKHPRTMNGFKDATSGVDQVKHWWGLWPDANIGLRTGQASGWIVVDIDDPKAFDRLQEELGTFPDTLRQKTGRGFQLFFQYPKGQEIRSKTGLRDDIDVRGEGGYIVAPPSLHVSGRTYQWTNRAPVASIPAFLLPLLLEPSPGQVISGEKGMISQGERNATLTSIGGTLRKSWATSCKKIGLNKPGEAKALFHDLRRTGLRNLVRAGVPEVVAMSVSGHKTRSVFDRYNIVHEDDIVDAGKLVDSYHEKTRQSTHSKVTEMHQVRGHHGR